MNDSRGGGGQEMEMASTPRHPLRLLRCLLDLAHVHERAFRQMIPFSLANLLERPDRVLKLRVIPRKAREHFRHVERLAQEPRDLAALLRGSTRVLNPGARFSHFENPAMSGH